MRVLLFGGFLGSGKTSVILQVARYIVEKRKQTVVIIENEIGEVGIDDKVLSGEGLKVREIFAGCVCCQISDSLLQAVKEIHEKIGADWLVIEATGLALPGNIAGLLKKYCRYCDSLRTVIVVDAYRWAELREVLERLVIPQVESGDVVLLNKIDETGKEAGAELVDELMAINCRSEIYPVIAKEELSGAVLKGVLRFE